LKQKKGKRGNKLKKCRELSRKPRMLYMNS